MKRFLIRAAIVFVVLGLLLTLGLAVLFGTDAGKHTIANTAASFASDALEGTVLIGQIEGSLFSDFTVRDIAVADADGHDVIRLRRLRVAYVLSELLDSHVHATDVEIEGPWVRLETMADGRTNLEALIPPSKPTPEEPATEPTKLQVTVDRFVLDQAAFLEGAVATATTHVDDVSIRLTVDAPLPDARVSIERISAHASAFDVVASIAGRLVLESNVAKVSELDIDVDGHRVVQVPSAEFDTVSTALTAKVLLDVPKSLVAKVSRTPELSVDLTATATVGHPDATAPWNVHLSGQLNGTPLNADASLPASFSALRSRVRLVGLDPHSLHAAAPSARIDLQVDADGPLDGLNVTAQVTAGKIHHTDVSIDKAVVLAKIEGIPNAIHGTATVRLDAIVASGQSFGDADLEVRVREAATQFEVRGALIGGPLFAIPEVALHASVDGEALSLDVDRIALRTRAILWRGENLKVKRTAAGNIVLRDINLASTAGVIAAEGTIVPANPLRASRDVHVRLDRVRLDTFSNIMPGAPTLGGELSAEVKLDRGHAVITASGKRLSVDEIAPLALDTRITLEGRELDLDLKLDGDVLGRASVIAKATTPPDPIDVSAWKRNPLDRIETIEAVIEGVDVREVGLIISQPELRTGRIDARIESGPRARRLEAVVTARDVRVSKLDLPVDMDFTALAAEAKTTANLHARLGGKTIATLQFDIDADVPTLERRGLKAIDDADANATLDLERLSVGRLVSAVNATSAIALTGILTGNVTVTKRGRDVDAHVDLHGDDVRARPSAPPIDVRTTLDLGRGRADANVWLEGAADLSVAAHAIVDTPAYALDVDAWQRMGFDDIRTVTASVTKAKFGVLSALSDVQLPSGGEVSLALRAGRGFADPFVWVDVRDVDVSPLIGKIGVVMTLDEFEKRARAEVGVFCNERPLLDGRLRFDRTIRKLIELPPSELMSLPLDATIRSKPFDLKTFFTTRALQKRFAGALNVKVDIAGRADAPKVDMAVAIDNAQIGATAFDKFTMDARVRGKDVTAKIDARQSDGGSLDVVATLEDNIDAKVVGQRFALDFVGDLLQAISGSSFGLVDSRLDIDVHAVGDPTEPDVDGSLTLTAKRIAVVAGVPPLEMAKVRVELADRKMKSKVDAQIGGGPVTIEATATVWPAEALAFDAKVVTDDIRVSAGPTAALASLNIEAHGERSGDTLTIDVVSDGGTVLIPGDPGGGQLLPVDPMTDVVFVDPAGAAARRRAERLEKSTKKGLQTIVHFSTKGALKVEGDQMRTAVEAKVDLQPSPDGPAISGAVWLPRGNIKVVAHEYEIERARVVFDGQVPVNPRLDLVMSKDFANALFKVSVTGTSKDPELTFAAEPPAYSRGELMQVFLGGEPGVESGGDEAAQRSQALSAAAGLLLGPVTQAIQQSLPIDTIKFDTGGGQSPDGTTTSPALTLGKWITDDLFLAYKFTFAGDGTEASSEGLLRYRFSGTWVAELSYQQIQAGAAEVFWVKRF